MEIQNDNFENRRIASKFQEFFQIRRKRFGYYFYSDTYIYDTSFNIMEDQQSLTLRLIDCVELNEGFINGN